MRSQPVLVARANSVLRHRWLRYCSLRRPRVRRAARRAPRLPPQPAPAHRRAVAARRQLRVGAAEAEDAAAQRLAAQQQPVTGVRLPPARHLRRAGPPSGPAARTAPPPRPAPPGALLAARAVLCMHSRAAGPGGKPKQRRWQAQRLELHGRPRRPRPAPALAAGCRLQRGARLAAEPVLIVNKARHADHVPARHRRRQYACRAAPTASAQPCSHGCKARADHAQRRGRRGWPRASQDVVRVGHLDALAVRERDMPYAARGGPDRVGLVRHLRLAHAVELEGRACAARRAAPRHASARARSPAAASPGARHLAARAATPGARLGR